MRSSLNRRWCDKERLQELYGEPLVGVTRGGRIESIHHVAACALGARGDVLYAAGNIDTPVFLRSTAKPFIAAACVAAGVRERFGVSMEEIAVMAASHSGEDFHVRAVRSILEKIGLPEQALQCGAHLPYNESAAHAMLREGRHPSAVHNNCSGKHAGILALALALGADTATYLDAANPAQQQILALCARLSDENAATWPLGIDGCGIPVYATPLRKAALAFSRFATLNGIAERDAMALLVVRDAMVSYPEYVSGTNEFDAELMRAGSGNIACKAGAEGVHGAAVIDKGIGFASKVIDGSNRGRAPVTVGVLRRVDGLSQSQADALASFAHPILRNRAGTAVGEVRADV